MSLKTRINKDKSHLNYATIDELHNEKMMTFNMNNCKEMKEELINKIELTKEKIKEIENDKINGSFNQINDFNKKILNLKIELENYENELKNDDEIEYEILNYLNTNDDIINTYYNNNTNVSVNLPLKTNKKIIKEKIKIVNVDKSNSILKIFKKTDEKYINPITLYNNYIELNDNTKIIKNNITNYMCDICKHEMNLLNSESRFICKKCGNIKYLIIDTDKPNYNESETQKQFYPYKRMNHLTERLNQFQGKDNKQISEDDYKKIEDEIKKNNIDVSKINVLKMKKILKACKLCKYYEHISIIISKLTGKPLPCLNKDMEDKIKNYFRLIQEPFVKCCPIDRLNFLSYAYVIHKIFEILNLHEYLSYFPLLKSKEKLKIQDNLWEMICNYRDLPFYPSKI